MNQIDKIKSVIFELWFLMKIENSLKTKKICDNKFKNLDDFIDLGFQNN